MRCLLFVQWQKQHLSTKPDKDVRVLLSPLNRQQNTQTFFEWHQSLYKSPVRATWWPRLFSLFIMKRAAEHKRACANPHSPLSLLLFLLLLRLHTECDHIGLQQQHLCTGYIWRNQVENRLRWRGGALALLSAAIRAKRARQLFARMTPP